MGRKAGHEGEKCIKTADFNRIEQRVKRTKLGCILSSTYN